jgi:broad specificity phosphatase PhoE
MELVFIRHAQNERDGTDDPHLTALGTRQAEHLAKKAPSWPRPTEILVSPSRRAQETAAPIAVELGLTPVTIPWLDEIRWPQGQAAFADGLYGVPEESLFEPFRKRVAEGVIGMLAARGVTPAGEGRWSISSSEHRLLLVGHGGANAVAIDTALGIQTVPWTWYRLSFVHTAMTRLRAFKLKGGSVFGLVRHGDVTHLPRELRTG